MDNNLLISPRRYPNFNLNRIENPNRFFALPVIGGAIKLLILIPVFLEIWVLWLLAGFLLQINSLIVLFTGKYWQTAYTIQRGIINLSAKSLLYLYGLTNQHPGFNFSINDPLIRLDIAKPEHPNRLFAAPLFGGLARLVVMIPFFIYISVIYMALNLGSIVTSFAVLFGGKYPESIYELGRDYTRLSLAVSVYFTGLSDTYPSFYISLNHKIIKLTLIILAIILGILS